MFYFLLRIVKYDYSIFNKQKVVVHLNHHQFWCKKSIIDLGILFYTCEVFPHVYLRNSTDYFNFIQEMTDFFNGFLHIFLSLIKKKEYINNQLNRQYIYIYIRDTHFTLRNLSSNLLRYTQILNLFLKLYEFEVYNLFDLIINRWFILKLLSHRSNFQIFEAKTQISFKANGETTYISTEWKK